MARVRDPLRGARLSFEPGQAMDGWNAPSFAPWLEASMERASNAVFGLGAVHSGCGGSIPFMGMLGRQFPHTQFLITGVRAADHGLRGAGARRSRCQPQGLTSGLGDSALRNDCQDPRKEAQARSAAPRSPRG